MCHYVFSWRYRTTNSTNTYDWMQATASSSAVSNSSRVPVIMLRVMLVLIRFSAAELTMVMRRCPAVMFAVSRTPKAKGRIRILIVSIIIMKGIRGVGEPSGSMWANAIDGFFISPVITVAIHRGRAIAMFIDS